METDNPEFEGLYEFDMRDVRYIKESRTFHALSKVTFELNPRVVYINNHETQNRCAFYYVETETKKGMGRRLIFSGSFDEVSYVFYIYEANMKKRERFDSPPHD